MSNIDNIIALAEHQKKAGGDDDGDIVTEDSAALMFAELHRDKLRFDHDAGKWFVWDGARWRRETTKLAFCWARDLARELVEDEPNKVRYISSKVAFASGVERFGRADRVFAVTSELWDRDPYLLGTPDGTVNLRTGDIIPARQEDFITKATAVGPDDLGDCPLWMRFLTEATNGDQELIKFLQCFCGYMLTGDVKEHALLFVYGTGRNGKTVFLNTISGIFGDYATTAAMETFVASSMDRHPTDLAMLQGARLVTASETEEGRAWAESRIKQITGGDPITARFMRQDFFTFRPQFKLVVIGNHKPALRNCDEAARRRFNIIPFVYKPPVPDGELEDKLRAEWPGILRWMVNGCLDWQHNGLVRPPVVVEATDQYFTEQDLVRQWIEDCCDVDRLLSDTSANLYRSWVDYAVGNGEHSGTRKWFSGVLANQGFRPYRTNSSRGFFGIVVRDASPPPDDRYP